MTQEGGGDDYIREMDSQLSIRETSKLQERQRALIPQWLLIIGRKTQSFHYLYTVGYSAVVHKDAAR